MDLRHQLHDLYREFFSSAAQKYGELALRCSAPLLIGVSSQQFERWKEASHRILVVGQETLGWDFEAGRGYPWPYPKVATLQDFLEMEDGIAAMQHGYEQFDFSAKQPQNLNGPFWRAFQKFKKGPTVEVLWSNLFRCSFSRDGEDFGSVYRNATWDEWYALMRCQHGLLAREIEVLDPTCVVFFTGPSYDAVLVSEFSRNSRTSELAASEVAEHFTCLQAEGDRPIRQMAHVRIESGRCSSRAIRTYHPNYLNRSAEKRMWIDEVVAFATA